MFRFSKFVKNGTENGNYMSNSAQCNYDDCIEGATQSNDWGTFIAMAIVIAGLIEIGM